MRTIFKYTIPAVDRDVEIEMPPVAGAVFVGAQHPHMPDAIQVWFEVEVTGQTTKRKLRIFGTGHEIPTDYEYLGTAIVGAGQFVWHLFEHVA